ncbi:MAG: hypothetical protein FIA89_09965 [Geobacter sp.]|nr:hypothetical protein [Geobacter sp.]
MSLTIRKDIPTPLELQYQELKKQALVDRNTDQTRNFRKERPTDQGPLTSPVTDDNETNGRKPSQPVTPEEMQALRRTFSIYA